MTPLLLVSLLAAHAADDPWADASTRDLHGYVRAVSLDVRGVVPSAEELAAIEAAGTLDDATLDAWLASAAFTDIVVARHQERFWNVLELNVMNSRRLSRRNGIYFVSSRANAMRGQRQLHCGEAEAEVDAENRPLSWTDNGDGSISEGWVWVSPYWDPDNPVQVCALDAQTQLVSDAGVDCSTPSAQSDPTCGCGPDLQWCMPVAVEDEIEAAFESDIDKRVRQMLDSDAPYSTIFSGNTLYVDGASAHFFRHLAAFRPDDYESPVDIATLPELDYADRTLTPVALPDHHAGVLTAPGWLLRHQTNRGRANRFYGGFLCSEFLPTESAPASTDIDALPTPNLQVRDGCLDCHTRLEPWAAYWGRWAQAGAVHLPADTHPIFDDDCVNCRNSCSDVCDDHYITEAGHPDETAWVGTFQPYAFLLHDDAANPGAGPLAWVERARTDGSLAGCAVRQTTDWLLHATPDDAAVGDWSDAFSADEDYRSLVRAVVTSPAYWGGVQ